MEYKLSLTITQKKKGKKERKRRNHKVNNQVAASTNRFHTGSNIIFSSASTTNYVTIDIAGVHLAEIIRDSSFSAFRFLLTMTTYRFISPYSCMIFLFTQSFWSFHFVLQLVLQVLMFYFREDWSSSPTLPPFSLFLVFPFFKKG